MAGHNDAFPEVADLLGSAELDALLSGIPLAEPSGHDLPFWGDGALLGVPAQPSSSTGPSQQVWKQGRAKMSAFCFPAPAATSQQHRPRPASPHTCRAPPPPPLTQGRSRRGGRAAARPNPQSS